MAHYSRDSRGEWVSVRLGKRSRSDWEHRILSVFNHSRPISNEMETTGLSGSMVFCFEFKLFIPELIQNKLFFQSRKQASVEFELENNETFASFATWSAAWRKWNVFHSSNWRMFWLHWSLLYRQSWPEKMQKTWLALNFLKCINQEFNQLVMVNSNVSGYVSKKQKCKKVCDVGRKPDKCDDCRDIGRKCLKKTKMVDQCTGKWPKPISFFNLASGRHGVENEDEKVHTYSSGVCTTQIMQRLSKQYPSLPGQVYITVSTLRLQTEETNLQDKSKVADF